MTDDLWDDAPPPSRPARALCALLAIVTSAEIVLGLALLLLVYA